MAKETGVQLEFTGNPIGQHRGCGYQEATKVSWVIQGIRGIQGIQEDKQSITIT